MEMSLSLLNLAVLREQTGMVVAREQTKKIFRPLLGKINGGRTVGEKGAVLATTDVSCFRLCSFSRAFCSANLDF